MWGDGSKPVGEEFMESVMRFNVSLKGFDVPVL
jgi:hypothetical protein